MLVPTRCAVCRALGPSPCRTCWATLRPAPPVPPPTGVDVCHSLLAYEGGGRELVARLKYRNCRSTVAWLADAMGRLAGASLSVPASPPAGPPPPSTVVTWVPTTATRRRQRGFDQAALLAAGVARRLDLPCRSLLVRIPGPPQTGLDRRARRQGPAYVAPAAVPARVLVVDDVLTTGATLAAAARALRGAGAVEVLAVTAARTPRKASLKVAVSSSDAFQQP